MITAERQCEYVVSRHRHCKQSFTAAGVNSLTRRGRRDRVSRVPYPSRDVRRRRPPAPMDANLNLRIVESMDCWHAWRRFVCWRSSWCRR